MNSKKACERKTRYTKAEVIIQQQFKKKQGGASGSIYHCEHCKHWHITSKSRNRIPNFLWNKIKEKPNGEVR